MKALHVLLLWLGLAGGVAAEEFVGIVQPLRDLTLSLGVGGVVADLPVSVGQSVRAGQLLLALDDRAQVVESERRRLLWEDRSELVSLEARQGILKGLFENARTLFEKTGGISRDELQKLELELIATEGRIKQLRSDEAREKLEYEGAEQERQAMRLLAPVDGVVTQIQVDVGEWSKPGEPVLRLVNSAVCFLDVSVSRQAARQLKRGGRQSVWVEGHGKPLGGRLTFVSPVADAASGLVQLRVQFDNPQGRIRPGSTGWIRVGSDDKR